MEPENGQVLDASLARRGGNPLGSRPFIRLAVCFYSLLTASGLTWLWIRTGDPFPDTLPGRQPIPGLLGGAAAGLLVTLGCRIGLRRARLMRWMANELRRFLPDCSPLECLVLALVSAIGEEMFFRGAMQPALGLVLTSLLFGLVHVGPDAKYLLWTGFAIVLGFALGWLLEWTGSLCGCILAHATVNFINLLQIMHLEPNP